MLIDLIYRLFLLLFNKILTFIAYFQKFISRAQEILILVI